LVAARFSVIPRTEPRPQEAVDFTLVSRDATNPLLGGAGLHPAAGFQPAFCVTDCKSAAG
jgi:hypothetical protein